MNVIYQRHEARDKKRPATDISNSETLLHLLPLPGSSFPVNPIISFLSPLSLPPPPQPQPNERGREPKSSPRSMNRNV